MRYRPLLLLLVIVPAPAQTVYQGKVVKIANDDTLSLVVDREQYRIRLADIDTPEHC